MLKNIFVKIGRYARSFFISFFTEKVGESRFKSNYQKAKTLYLANRATYKYQKYVMPEWQENTNAIESYFLSSFDINFLRNPVIKKTMFMYTLTGWKNIQKALITEQLGRILAKNLLRESNIGKPLLNDWDYASSGNNIHHLYHLEKFFRETGVKASDLNSVVEIGGGYGNMAKIFKKINPNSTHTIIDIPIFSYIQSVYLKTMLGPEAVNLVAQTSGNLSIIKGKVNLVPLSEDTIHQIGTLISPTDLFLSTWALSESNEAMQRLIKELRYFDARYLLLAYQKSNQSFAFAEQIANTHADYITLFNTETAYLKDNYYLFAKLKQ